MPRGRQKGSKWSDAAKAKLRAQGQTPNLKLGTQAARASPVSGSFETNQEAKRWWVVSPLGERYDVVNLRKWLRDHADMLPDGRDDLAYAGLRQVQAWLLGRTKRQASAWKGWTLDRPNASKII